MVTNKNQETANRQTQKEVYEREEENEKKRRLEPSYAQYIPIAKSKIQALKKETGHGAIRITNPMKYISSCCSRGST